MKSIKPEKEKITITSAIFFSLLIHFTVGTLLLFGLSNNLISSPKLNGINLVWVSLDAKSKDSGTELKEISTKKTTLALENTVPKPVNIETPAPNQEVIPISTVKSMNLTGMTALAKYDASGMEAKELSGNINGKSANEATDNKFNLNAAIAYPLYKENAPPVYPEIARVRGYEGIVLVFAEILPNGRVGEIKIRKSSGYAILDQSAIQAVKPWKFEPAKKAGNPFTAWVELPIKFILHNNSQS